MLIFCFLSSSLEQAAKHQLFAGTRVLSVRVSSSVSPSPQPRDLGARKTQAAAFLSSASSLSPEICSSTKLHRPGVTRTEEDERESAVQPKNRFEGHPEKSLATESFVSDAGQIPLSPGSSLAAVCRVGYATVQGQTVRRLLYPTKMRIDFEKGMSSRLTFDAPPPFCSTTSLSLRLGTFSGTPSWQDPYVAEAGYHGAVCVVVNFAALQRIGRRRARWRPEEKRALRGAPSSPALPGACLSNGICL